MVATPVTLLLHTPTPELYKVAVSPSQKTVVPVTEAGVALTVKVALA